MGEHNLQNYNFLRWFMTFFKNLKFKRKLFTSYIVVIIIPLAILGLYSYMQAKSFLLKEAKQGLNESISQIAENLNSKFKRYDSLIYFITYNAKINQIVNNEDSSYFHKYVDYTEVLDPLFNTILDLNSEIESLVIYTSNNSITERTNSIQSLKRIQSEPWFNIVKTDWRVHWIKENQLLIGLSKFYEPFTDAPLNIIYTKMRSNSVFDINMKDFRESSIYISDTENNIIFSESNSNNSKMLDVGKKVVELQEGEISINGIQFLLIKKPIAEIGWTLSYLSPVSAIAINAQKIVKAMIFIILACFIFLLLMTWVFSNTFVKRIYSLNRKMKLVEDGNLKIVVSSSSRDEIGELTNRFRKMLENINILIDESYQSKIIQKEAEMKALQAQINPHFLYNTLSLINWKAIQIDATEISQITRNVSKFYRKVLNNGNNIISIEDEIANSKCYVDIQLAMHNNSFEVEYNIDPEIYKYEMIKIILQPIVENAIEHGIDLLPAGSGKLTLSGFVEDECILFQIEDNGPGMEREVLDTILSQDSGGYGLKNVQARLFIFFGAEYGVTISSVIGKGTCVTVRIPQFNDYFNGKEL